MKKTCKTCKTKKPVSQFYKNDTYTDGRFSTCIPCAIRRTTERRRANLVQALIAEASRRANRTPAQRKRDLLKQKLHKHTEAGRASERRRRSSAANRVKYAARNAVNNALMRGEMTRGPCEVCGKRPTDGHHDDYSKPLAVRWLCRKHHDEWHKRYLAKGAGGGTATTG